MVPIVRRMIWKDRSRFAITVVGVGFSVMLMLFLSGVYEGVKRGATGYVAGSRADVWVCQNTTTNLLRSSSYWDAGLLERIGQLAGVREATGILRVLTTATINGESVTLFMFGFDPKSDLGAPSVLIDGTAQIRRREIVLDKAFASKHRLATGESLAVHGAWFRVAGISDNTNATVAQFAFTTLDDAQQLIGMPNCTSFGLVTLDGTQTEDQVIRSIVTQFPALTAFPHNAFNRNNLRELATGVLPILAAISFFGAVIATMVITLMLYGSVLEQREDYALLKAMGAREPYVVGLMLRQAITVAMVGFFLGLAADLAVAPLLATIVPEMAPVFTLPAGLMILGGTLCVGVAGSWGPVHTLARVFPAEVFRA